MAKVFGENNVKHLDNKDLVDKFGSWSIDNQIGFIDEFNQKGTDMADNLKRRITNQKSRVENKHESAYTGDDCINYIATTNDLKCLYIDDRARRFFIILNNKIKPEPQSYYDNFSDKMEDTKEIAGLYWFLKERDIKHFNPNARPPLTAGFKDVVEAGHFDFNDTLKEMWEEKRDVFSKEVVTTKDITRASYGVEHERLSQKNSKVKDFIYQNGGIRVEIKTRERRITGWVIRNHNQWLSLAENNHPDFIKQYENCLLYTSDAADE